MTEDHDEDERLMLVLGRHVEATRNAAAFEAVARAICWVSECEFRVCTAARRCMADAVGDEYKDQARAAIEAMRAVAPNPSVVEAAFWNWWLNERKDGQHEAEAFHAGAAFALAALNKDQR